MNPSSLIIQPPSCSWPDSVVAQRSERGPSPEGCEEGKNDVVLSDGATEDSEDGSKEGSEEALIVGRAEGEADGTTEATNEGDEDCISEGISEDLRDGS